MKKALERKEIEIMDRLAIIKKSTRQVTQTEKSVEKGEEKERKREKKRERKKIIHDIIAGATEEEKQPDKIVET